MFAHSENATRAAMREVVESVGDAVPTFAKLSPNVTDIVAIARAAIDAGAAGLTLVNSVMGLLIDADARRPRSAPAVAASAARRSSRSRCARYGTCPGSFPGVPIIGTGGVSSGIDAIEMMLAGAPRSVSVRRRSPIRAPRCGS